MKQIKIKLNTGVKIEGSIQSIKQNLSNNTVVLGAKLSDNFRWDSNSVIS